MRSIMRSVSLERAAVSVPTTSPSSLSSPALVAIKDLTGAVWGESLYFDRASRLLAGADGRPCVAIGKTIAMRVAAALGEDAGAGGLTWLPGHEDGGAVLLIGAPGGQDAIQAVALGFNDTPAGCQLRLGQALPALVTLVKSLVRAEAEMLAVKQRQVAATAALDNLDYGVIAVRNDRTPLIVNRSAQAMLADGGPLQLHRGFLRPADHRDAIRFHVALDTVIGGHGRDPAEALMLLLADHRATSGGDRTLLVIAPVQRAMPGDGSVDGAAALIYVFRPDLADVRGLEPLCRLLGLSGAETRLVTELLVGHTVTEAATSMRVKPETARSYLKQVFAKTGTHRQTDLVALLYRYTLTARGRFPCRAA